MKNQNVYKFIRIISIVFGLLLIMQPAISNCSFKYSSKNIITRYQEKISKLNTNQKNNELEKARKYNNEFKMMTDYAEGKNYNNILNFNEIIGYIEIPKIFLMLPIYHGTSEKTLEKGVGHLEWSFLPIGGKGTHSILTAHNGIDGKKLFDDIEKLEIRDKFYICILDNKLEYEVDKIDIILPEDIDVIQIDENEDYVTLLTCIPYKINTHRLLVRGTRINQDEEVVVDEK